MPQVLFIAHGMGDNAQGWEKPVVEQLDSLLAGYPKYAGESRAFSSRIMIEPLTYDAVFDKYVLKWGQQKGALAEFAQSNGIALDGVLGLLGSGQLPSDVSSALWETFLDPVLYRGSLVGESVLRLVSDQLRTRWAHHLHQSTTSGEPLEVSVLAHSLGTIVMSEVLAFVGENRDGLMPELASSKQSISVFMTLANVSQLGPRKLHRINSYDSVVRPDTAPKPSNGLDPFILRFINARHRFDPFCFWQRFLPKNWGASYEVIDELKHLHAANPHGFRHYLAHPRVHIPLFRSLLGNTAITKKHEDAAIAAFVEIPAKAACTAEVDALVAELTALCNLPSSDEFSLDEFVKRALQMSQFVDRIQGSCLKLPKGAF